MRNGHRPVLRQIVLAGEPARVSRIISLKGVDRSLRGGSAGSMLQRQDLARRKLVESHAKYLERCMDLALEALDAGDEPFGSILVSADGRVLREARNRAVTGDPTQHPEFELARWAAQELSPEERGTAVVYTSGEHCPMCAAAHAWAGLGRIVYASSSRQLGEWLATFGAPPSPLAALSITDVAPDIPVKGPFPGFDARVRALHTRQHGAAD